MLIISLRIVPFKNVSKNQTNFNETSKTNVEIFTKIEKVSTETTSTEPAAAIIKNIFKIEKENLFANPIVSVVVLPDQTVAFTQYYDIIIVNPSDDSVVRKIKTFVAFSNPHSCPAE